MSALPFLDARPTRAAKRSTSSSGSDVSRVASPNTIRRQRLAEDTLESANAFQPPLSPTDSSGRVDVVETPVSFRGLYGHIGLIVQCPTGPSPLLSPPRPGLARRRRRVRPTSPSPPLPPSTAPPPGGDNLPGFAAYNPGPYQALPRNLDLNDPLAGQFIRGIANIHLATTQIDDVDTEHVRLLARSGLPHLGGGIPAAREARRALRAAEQELHEAFEAALAAVQQNRTNGEQLAYLGTLLHHLEGWIMDSEAQAANYARRMETTVGDLRQTNATLHQENEHLEDWIADSEAQTANYARRMENAVATLKHANAQLCRENQALGAELQERDAELQRRTVRIQYLEYEVAEYAGYN